MLMLLCDIEITPKTPRPLAQRNFSFTAVHEIEISKSFETQTATARIKLPKRANFQGKPLAEGSQALFRRGDAIKITLGYGQALSQKREMMFTGYVSAVKPDEAVTLDCQDAMWLLKQTDFTKAYRAVTLQTLLADMVNGVQFKASAVNLGPLRITRQTPAQVLDYLKQRYGVRSFVRDNTLYVGYPNASGLLPAPRVAGEFDIQQDVISSDLEYLRKEDVKIKVKAISTLPDNSKIEVEEGDKDGELRTFNYFNVQKTELQRIAKGEIERLRYEGYRGSFTTFLLPYVQPGDLVELSDTKIPDRRGRYFVKAVTTSFGTQGGRQKIEIDRKI